MIPYYGNISLHAWFKNSKLVNAQPNLMCQTFTVHTHVIGSVFLCDLRNHNLSIIL